MSKKSFAWIVIATLFTACPSVEGGGTGKGVISGRALDAGGNPIAGALIWIKPAITTGFVTAHTDGNGRYIAEGLPNVPYEVYAWAQPTFNGKRMCLRLGHDNAADYDAVVPTQGVVRDFRWKLEGPIEDRGNDVFFGGQVRAIPVFRHDGDFSGETNIELRMEPIGKLVDGGSGKAITRTVTIKDNPFAENIPLGNYRFTASLLNGNTRSALDIGKNESTLSSEAMLEFESSSDSCGGDFGNGTSRAFLYVGQP